MKTALSYIPTALLLEELAIRGTTKIPPATPPSSVNQIIFTVAEVFGIPVEAILSRRKTKAVSRARFACWLLIKEREAFSATEIASFFRRKDHGTILHGFKAGRELIQADPSFAKNVRLALQRITPAAASLPTDH